MRRHVTGRSVWLFCGSMRGTVTHIHDAAMGEKNKSKQAAAAGNSSLSSLRSLCSRLILLAGGATSIAGHPIEAGTLRCTLH